MGEAFKSDKPDCRESLDGKTQTCDVSLFNVDRVKDYIEDLEYLDDLDLECIKRKKRDISFKTGKKPYGKGLFSKRIRW